MVFIDPVDTFVRSRHIQQQYGGRKESTDPPKQTACFVSSVYFIFSHRGNGTLAFKGAPYCYTPWKCERTRHTRWFTSKDTYQPDQSKEMGCGFMGLLMARSILPFSGSHSHFHLKKNLFSVIWNFFQTAVPILILPIPILCPNPIVVVMVIED